MGIVYMLNGVDGNSLVQGIYTDEKMLCFGIGGRFIEERGISYRYSRLREIDLVSIINVQNQMEVAYSINKGFQKYPVYADIFEIIRWCNTHPNLVFVGKRENTYKDNMGSVEYSQYLFGFTKGKLNEKELQEVMRVNG